MGIVEDVPVGVEDLGHEGVLPSGHIQVQVEGNAVGQVGSGPERDVRQRTGLVRHELAERTDRVVEFDRESLDGSNLAVGAGCDRQAQMGWAADTFCGDDCSE